MAITLINPRFSFVKFGTVKPTDDSLPVVADGDLAFQSLLQLDSADIAEAIMAGETLLYLVLPNATITTVEELTAATLINFGSAYPFTPYRVSETRVLLYWPHGLPNFVSATTVGFCFRLAMVVYEDPETPVIYTSNEFHRTDSEFTSLLRYSCDENAFDFNYCQSDEIENKARIYLHLSKPQYPEEKSIHIRSNGVRKVLKYSISKEYEAETELFNEALHETVNMALSHDYVHITGKYYQGNVVKSSAYDIDWNSEMRDYELAPAKLKLLASTFSWRNSNCAVCEVYVPETPCIAISIVGEIDFPDAAAEVPYEYSYEIAGTAPYEVVPIDLPAWMTVSIDGTTVNHTGTPTEASEGPVSVHYKLTNCDGAHEVETDEEIDITPECVTPEIEGTTMPNAVQHHEYSFSVAITGTGPFSLSNIVKPSWITLIEIDGNSVVFTGYSDDVAAPAAVSFTVSNECSEETFEWESSVQVVPDELELAWDFTEIDANGALIIFKNSVEVLHQTVTGSGTIAIAYDDFIQIQSVGGTGLNTLFVGNSIDGTMYSSSDDTIDNEYEFNANQVADYSVSVTITEA